MTTRIAYQLSGKPDLMVPADLYVFDLDELEEQPDLIAKAHAAGKKVYAYFSAGTAEKWRKDYRDFPADALGRAMKDWPDERWLDVSKAKQATIWKIMVKRIDRAHELGCDGIDPDNTDAYDNGGDAGLKVSRADCKAWLNKLADAAHARGMGCTLKNSVDLIAYALSENVGVDVFVNEEAGHYGEADKYAPALAAGKPVVCIEYRRSDFDKPHPKGMQVLWKDGDLHAPVKAERIA